MNKKFSFLATVTLILFSEFACAQITFQKRYGWIGDDVGNAVQQTFDGGYIITGNGTRSSGEGKLYLIKTNEFGDTLWTKIIGRIGSFSEGYSVAQTTDSGFIVTGFSNGGALNLIRTNINGDTLWSKLSFESSIGYAVQQTFDGGFIVTGRTGSFGAGLDEVYLAKTDAYGNTIWSKSFGGAYYEQGNSLAQTSDSGFIIAGMTNSFGAGNDDIYLIKTNSIGDTMWTKTIGDSGVNSANSIQQTFDGGFIVTGVTLDLGAGNFSSFLLKTDSSGNTIWCKVFSGSDETISFSVVQANDSGYVFAGYANSDVWIVKTNSIGDTLWSKTFGEQYFETVNSVRQTSDGGFILTGSKNFFDSLGTDIFLIKTDSNGFNICNENSYPITVSSAQFQVTLPSTTVSIGHGLTIHNTDVFISGAIYTTPVCNSVGMSEINILDKIIILPNPTNGTFTIGFNQTLGKGIVNIVDGTGKIIFTKNICNSKQEEINLQNVSQGIYFVQVIDGENQYIEKLIVQ